MEIDIEKLRKDLIEEYEAIMFNISPSAMIDISEIENASDDELIQFAIRNNFDIRKYEV